MAIKPLWAGWIGVVYGKSLASNIDDIIVKNKKIMKTYIPVSQQKRVGLDVYREERGTKKKRTHAVAVHTKFTGKVKV